MKVKLVIELEYENGAGREDEIGRNLHAAAEHLADSGWISHGTDLDYSMSHDVEFPEDPDTVVFGTSIDSCSRSDYDAACKLIRQVSENPKDALHLKGAMNAKMHNLYTTRWVNKNNEGLEAQLWESFTDGGINVIREIHTEHWAGEDNAG